MIWGKQNGLPMRHCSYCRVVFTKLAQRHRFSPPPKPRKPKPAKCEGEDCPGKPKVVKDMKEEVSDMVLEVLNMLKVSGKNIEYSQYQKSQLQYVSPEIKHLSRQDLGRFADMLTKQMQEEELRPYMEHLDRAVLKKMRTLQAPQ